MNINRRSLFGGALATIFCAGKWKKTNPRLVLVDDVNDWKGGAWTPKVVTLDGIDVSNQSYRVEIYSDGSGTVYGYHRNPDGTFRQESGGLVRWRRSGAVTIQERAS